jgi:RHS repeat-associated protein
MVHAGSIGTSVTFKYDPFGRRIYKSSSAGTSVFAYDGDNLIEETNSSGTAVAQYSQTQNIDEPLAMLRSSATSYFHADGLGSITSLSNSAGSIANTYTYDSFGKLTASTGSLVNPFQYTARESDTETGLYYYRARYYDLNVGRFLREDSIRFNAGINFYAYVGNDPGQFVDPYGSCPPKKSCGIKKAPEYNVSGTVPGGTGFSWGAEFLRDPTHDPRCCEVRQWIDWDRGRPPAGFDPPSDYGPNYWYEDRDAKGKRYGRRTGPHHEGNGPGNWNSPFNYCTLTGCYGYDRPSFPHHTVLRFFLEVVDVCNGGTTIYKSATLIVDF